jgi:chemotaxis protein histidine kinase CheA
MDAFRRMLFGMRERFLDELPERCDTFDNLVLALEREVDNRETFNELFRGIHSLKGAGGTHGIGILTTICHQFESLLTATLETRAFDSAFVDHAFAYIDLLRRGAALARNDEADYGEIVARLEALRQAVAPASRMGLIAESSLIMARLYQKALDGLPVQLAVVDNGLAGLERLVHERFDFIVLGRELKELNGIALTVALRAAQNANSDVPAILVTSNRDGIPAQAQFAAIVARDGELAGHLRAAVQVVLQI